MGELSELLGEAADGFCGVSGIASRGAGLSCASVWVPVETGINLGIAALLGLGLGVDAAFESAGILLRDLQKEPRVPNNPNESRKSPNRLSAKTLDLFPIAALAKSLT